MLETEKIIRGYLNDEWWVKENANITKSNMGLNNQLSKAACKNYWLTEVYDELIRKAHNNGFFHIHNLGALTPYTYYGKESLILKINEEPLLLSFEQLYNSLDVEEQIYENEVYIKIPESPIFVMDKDGWTTIECIIKKRKTKEMIFIKNRGGRSVIVTKDHPMISLGGKKQGIDLLTHSDSLYTSSITDKLDKYFYKESLDLVEEILTIGWFRECKTYLNGIKITKLEPTFSDDVVHSTSQSIKRIIPLSEEFGYFVGFTLAEGYLSNDKHRAISISQKEIDPLLRINKFLQTMGVIGTIEKDDVYNKYVLNINNVFVRFIFEKIFKIAPGSRHKNLPPKSIIYSKDFNRGIISGLIDGDGTIAGKTALCIRIVSRTLLEQASVILELLGFTPRDRAIEGQGTTRFYMGKEVVQRFPLYGLSFRKLSTIYLPSDKYIKTKNSTKAWMDEDRNKWHKILNVDSVDIPDEWIYDITTSSNTLLVNGMWNHNCAGWNIERLLNNGFSEGVGKQRSRPAKHLRTALGQLYNATYKWQGDFDGAVAWNNLDTYLAPFIRYDKLDQKGVDDLIQEFIFDMNNTTRIGGQSSFSNVTLDIIPPKHLKDEQIIIGGNKPGDVLGDFEKEMTMFNEAWWKQRVAGDADGRPQPFPIETINVDKNFDWDNETLFRAVAKRGSPYFANFVNTDMNPSDSRSMCCRLRLDLTELRRKNGGMFGAGDDTGSIGIVTMNLPHIAYVSKDEVMFFEVLRKYIDIARDSLELKRNFIETLAKGGQYYSVTVNLKDVYVRHNKYFANHFSTIGLIGMNEACMILLHEGIESTQGLSLSIKTLDFMRDVIKEYQLETGNLYNLEATPAETTSYDLALNDKIIFPDIYTQGDGDGIYYTNSTNLPVNIDKPLGFCLEHQNNLQPKYTGGSVFHVWNGEAISYWKGVSKMINRMVTNTEIPYFTYSPTTSICPVHGFISGKYETCPDCGRETEIWQRITGYFSLVKNWNPGKVQEFKERHSFSVTDDIFV